MNMHIPGQGQPPQEFVSIAERPIPSSIPEQLGKFTLGSIYAERAGTFQTNLPEGVAVVGVDLGGDSISAAVKTLKDGELLESEVLFDLRGVKNGAGYLALLEEAALFASKDDLPVGISFAGPVAKNCPVKGANVSVFMQELEKNYYGAFGTVFPTLAVAENDAVAGIKAGALHAQKHPGIKNVIYAINGSGLNTAVLLDGTVWSNESGHVEVVDELNPHGQTKSCGIFGDYVCLERIGASKAGIEDLWQQQTGEDSSGQYIEALYKGGNKLAAELYDNSALVTAMMVQGVAKALNIDLSEGSTAIVGHGGTFKFPNYGFRVQQIVGAHVEAQVPLFMTKDFSSNACLDGAALAALAKVA